VLQRVQETECALTLGSVENLDQGQKSQSASGDASG